MKRIHLLLLGILTAANLGALAVNVSIQAKAEVAGMNKMQMVRDRDFRYAVEYIVEDCKVDDGKIKC